MLVGRNENFRVPGMSAFDSIDRAVAYANAGVDCLFVPSILDPGAVAELVAAVAPKPVNVLVQNYDASDSCLCRAWRPAMQRRWQLCQARMGGIG